MPQLLLQSGSFKGIQSPFWSCHLLCQSIPFSPVWGPKCSSLFWKVHKNGEACSAYLYSKSQRGKGSGRSEAFYGETGSLEGIATDYTIFPYAFQSWFMDVDTNMYYLYSTIFVKELYGCEQMEFSLNCYQHSCLRVDLFPSDTGIMHEVKQNLWRNVMDGWQSQNEFVLLWDILTHFILIWPRGDQRVFVRYMPDSWRGFDRMRGELGCI